MTSLINIEKYKGSLKQASLDDKNNESLIIDDTPDVLYILDDIAKEIAKNMEIDTPSSCDSVAVKGEDIYLIEFKNRDYKNITSNDKRDIRKKAYQSRELLLSTFLCDKTIQYIAEHVHLWVVFKSMENESESFGKIVQKFNRYANGEKPEIKCKLGFFEGTFYKEIRTMSKDEFETRYVPIIVS